MFKWNLLKLNLFQFVPTAFSSFSGLHEMRLALPSFLLAPSTKCLYTVVLLFFWSKFYITQFCKHICVYIERFKNISIHNHVICLALKLHIVLIILQLLFCASLHRIRTFKITNLDPNKKYASDLRMPGISQIQLRIMYVRKLTWRKIRNGNYEYLSVSLGFLM